MFKQQIRGILIFLMHEKRNFHTLKLTGLSEISVSLLAPEMINNEPLSTAADMW